MRLSTFLAAVERTHLADTVNPVPVISSVVPSPTLTSPIPIIITFSEDVTGFVVGDLTVGNGTAGSFVTVNGSLYTASITPDGAGTVTVDINAAVCTDVTGNNSDAAVQFSIEYTGL